ncbi:hypothetical protein [Lysobacter tyrosinilyticus]
MPIWILLALPATWGASLFCAIAFRSNPIIVQASMLTSLFCTAAAFVAVPVAIYALIANPSLRTLQQGSSVAFCSLPILGMVVALLFGGI